MRVIKFVCLFALLLCLTETCLVLAEDGNPNKCGYLVRFAVNLLLNSYICAKGRLDMRIIFHS